jgi:hypothetical protein
MNPDQLRTILEENILARAEDFVLDHAEIAIRTEESGEVATVEVARHMLLALCDAIDRWHSMDTGESYCFSECGHTGPGCYGPHCNPEDTIWQSYRPARPSTYEVVCIEIGDEPVRWFIAQRTEHKGIILASEEFPTKLAALTALVALEEHPE